MRALTDQGVREVVLLGQTVNSYWDQGTPSDPAWRARLPQLRLSGGGAQQQHSEAAVAAVGDDDQGHDYEDGGVGNGEDGRAPMHQYKGYEVAEGFTQRSKPKKNSSDTIASDPEGGVSSY